MRFDDLFFQWEKQFAQKWTVDSNGPIVHMAIRFEHTLYKQVEYICARRLWVFNKNIDTELAVNRIESVQPETLRNVFI